MRLRPMRPPAPAITTRKLESGAAIVLPSLCPRGGIAGQCQAINTRERHPPLKPRAVVTLSHDDIGLSLAVAQCLRCLVIGRTIAGERGLKARKLEHHDAAARPALHPVATAT